MIYQSKPSIIRLKNLYGLVEYIYHLLMKTRNILPMLSTWSRAKQKITRKWFFKVFITTFMICKNDHLICFPLLPSLIFLYILTTWIQLLRFKYISKHLCKVIWPDQISVFNLIHQHLQLLQKMWQRLNAIKAFC